MTGSTPKDKLCAQQRAHWRRWLSRRTALLIGLAFVLVACSLDSADDLESIGMSLATDPFQAGTEFEFTFLAPEEVSLELASAPTGVEAQLLPTADEGYYQLAVSVAADTPRGAYNLGITVEEDGEETLLGWPFGVFD